jgi:hypothetical protein
MSFLDRFKIQPKYKSTDPEQRVVGVAELTDTPEDAAVLVSLAREDADARVRRAALTRIQDTGVLADRAASDADASIRAELVDRLARIAMTSDTADAALRALAALSDPKQIGTVAKESPVDAVRVEAVGRLTDVKSLSSVARHASDARVAGLAAARVQDPAELLNIAAKTDHKDVGIGALERAAAMGGADRATLDGLADRAKNKSVSKRAKAMVQAIDDTEAARKAALEQHQQRVTAFVASAQALGVSATAPNLAAELAALEADWDAFAASATEPLAASERARFGSANQARADARTRRGRAEREAMRTGAGKRAKISARWSTAQRRDARPPRGRAIGMGAPLIPRPRRTSGSWRASIRRAARRASATTIVSTPCR